MYKPHPREECLECRVFKKCKELGYGVPVDEVTLIKLALEPARSSEYSTRW